jgi:hypothetical protein
MASTLLGRLALAFKMGFSFGGKRNLYEVFGYQRLLTPADLHAKYQRQDIASRIVDMAPEEMWSSPPVMKSAHGIKAKWDSFATKIHLWERILQADKLCSFGPFSLLWLGLPGDIKNPASRLTDIDQLLYLQAYGGDSVKVKTYEEKTNSPRYGQPVTYEVKVGPVEQSKTKEVHYSRVIHIVDRPLQGLMFGEPRLAQIYNTLDDLQKITGGSAELFWLTANRGLQVDVDKEMDLEPGDAEALSDELDEYQHQLRRFIRTRGVKITPLGAEVSDPAGVFSVLISTLSGTTNIPQRILMGAEAGQLASEQDRANWSEYIERRAKVFAEPYILRPVIQKLEELGYLPEGSEVKANLGTKESVFEWPEFFHMSPLEEAATLNNRARSITNLSRRNQ